MWRNIGFDKTQLDVEQFIMAVLCAPLVSHLGSTAAACHGWPMPTRCPDDSALGLELPDQ
ncbi:hypothetical protein I546_1938 [Mycobacterium kansasii 732]|nr:hypothetical protein I546_1938 [Mycobacterium kansasii 732]